MTRKDARNQQALNRLSHCEWADNAPDMPTWLWLAVPVFLIGLWIVSQVTA